MAPRATGTKRPFSVLVVIHTFDLQILLLERTHHPGYWQSVTGSQEEGEALIATAIREVAEETGLDANAHSLLQWNVSNRFEIFHEWRNRYPPGVTHNVEKVFSLEVPQPSLVKTNPEEHHDQIWLPWSEAAAKTFSWTNRDAIISLALSRRQF